MITARWMGIHYLWIDALCIIQDSEHDWQVQSNVMGDIYAGSYCNIAAMNESNHDGFLRERRIEIIEPFLIRDPETPSSCTKFVIGYDDFWCNNLLSAPLHNRAWVLQERQLSPRTVHFGEQIFWECREHKACEAYPYGIPEEFSNQRTKAWRQGEQVFNPKSRLPQRSWLAAFSAFFWQQKSVAKLFPQREAYEYWSIAVEAYMQGELSYARDKSVAIQGLANRVRATTGERYLAGLWDGPDLAHSLLWYVPAREQANGWSSVKYPPFGMKGSRAPSWSWASVDAIIDWKCAAGYGQMLLQVEKTVIATASDVVRGSPYATEMHVSGRLMAVQLEIMNSNEDGSPHEDGSYAVRPVRTSPEEEPIESREHALTGYESTICLDEAFAPSRTIDVHLLPIVTEWRGRSWRPPAELGGLILKQHRREGRIAYERIGVFGFDPISADDDVPVGSRNSLLEVFARGAKQSIVLI